MEHFDVLIVGAGLSGIDAAYHLQKFCPGKTYVILEQRERIGGTWDLFRYPGIRSDSDMFTMGYSFRPWTHRNSISDGDAIRDYITDTACSEGIDRHIRFRHRIQRVAWSSAEARWTVEAIRKSDGESAKPVRMTCGFLFCCAGYYRYDAGYTPEFPGIDRFAGRIVHPQAWPEDLDYAGKRVVIIGSGATAVTLLPAMAKIAAHVVMLQRSPTYVVSLPARDAIANWLRRVLSLKWAYRLSRWKNIAYMMFVYQLAQRYPAWVKNGIIRKAQAELGSGYDVTTHFAPRYNPWEQRLCVVPDGDMFHAIRTGRASVVTDEIREFTANGIRLESGRELQADLVVTATGLVLQTTGGVKMNVDGCEVDAGQTLAYKGVMMSGVPNLAGVWLHQCLLDSESRLNLRLCVPAAEFPDRKGVRQVTPEPSGEKPIAPFVVGFNPGYIQRDAANWPKQGSKPPWRVHQNYVRDIISLKWSSVDSGGLKFSNPPA